jgi:hypothetical protein
MFLLGSVKILYTTWQTIFVYRLLYENVRQLNASAAESEAEYDLAMKSGVHSGIPNIQGRRNFNDEQLKLNCKLVMALYC